MERQAVGKFYNNLDIHFSIDQTEIHALNIAFERFLRVIPEHSHSNNSYEIHYIAYGQGRVRLNGINYQVGSGTLYVTGPHISHAQFPDPGDPMAEYCIYLKVHPSRKLPADHFLQCFIRNVSWFGQDAGKLHGLMQMIFSELEEQAAGYMTQVTVLLQQVMIEVVRNEEHLLSESHFGRAKLWDRTYLIIEESFLYEYQTITLQELAQRLGLSARQTQRMLKNHYGRTFLEKRTDARMSAAAILLQDTDRSVAKIAEQCGYSSGEHFSGTFRKYFGCSATAYRKQHTER